MHFCISDNTFEFAIASRLANLYGIGKSSRHIEARVRRKYLSSAGRELLREDMDNPRRDEEDPIWREVAKVSMTV